MKRIAAVLVATALLCAAAQADNAYYRVLAAKPNATMEDAVRVFYELATGADGADATFDDQAKALADLRIMPFKWATPTLKADRGKVAYMVCNTCNIKGGVTMRVFGPSERYCFRELVFIGVWTGGTQRDLMSGGELMGVLTWAAEYKESHGGAAPATQKAGEGAAEEDSSK